MRRRKLFLLLLAASVLGILLASRRLASRHVIVSVDETRFNEIAQAVQTAGLQVEARLENLSLLIGTVSDHKRQAVQAVDGVHCIEDDLPVYLH